MKAEAIYMNTEAYNEESTDYDALLVQYTPLVKRIAYHLMGRLPSRVQMEDLVQTGMIGLFEALKHYDASKGASFETYARIRIQGSMIDEVRRGDWTPRSVYKKSRLLSEAIREIEKKEGRDAKGSEVAEVLGISIDEYNRMSKDAAGLQVLSYEGISATDGSRDEATIKQLPGPYQALQKKLFNEGLAERIASLPERERLVMALYYDEELNMREIGEVLGITEGRVCQIHGQTLIRLRARMKDWTEENK